MKSSIKLEVGQQVFVKFNNDKNLRPMTVEKIGTKWTTLNANASYRSMFRALNGSRALESEGSPGTIYLSELEYANQCAVEAAWKGYRVLVDRSYSTPDLTIEQIQYMHRVVEESSK